jgi:hypothetical protein
MGAPRGRNASLWVIAALVITALAIAGWRLDALDWNASALVPDKMWDVTVAVTLEGHGGPTKVATFVPTGDDRQTVLETSSRSGGFELQTIDQAGGRVAQWHAADVSGPRAISYRYRVVTRAVRYDIDPTINLGDPLGAGVDPSYLAATEAIQSQAPDVEALALKLVPEDGALLGFLRATFDHVQGYKFAAFKGTTDALTALRLGEASCNGRSRLMVALLRNRGVPARLVGGLILTHGSKRTSHQWLEVFLGGHWLPFDALNHHFASLPARYLALYRGDEALFTHSQDIKFAHLFTMDSDLIPRAELKGTGRSMGLWAAFATIGVSLDLLTLIMMIPIGATVVTLFRNVLGVRTFGTFLPALVASAAHHTGLWWGLVGFIGLIVVVSIGRKILGRLELLHSPQMAVLLTTVIAGMLGVSWLGVELDLRNLARVSLFPVAILAITSERFALMEIEEGAAVAWGTMLRTAVVIGFCYLTMNSLSLQIVMIGFPELLLVIIAINIWLGRWMGLRLSEWVRFRSLITPKAVS